MSFVFMSEENNEGHLLQQHSIEQSLPFSNETKHYTAYEVDRIIPANQIAIERAIHITELQRNQEEYHRKLFQILKFTVFIMVILMLLM